MENSAVEIENLAGSDGVVVTHFETGADAIGTMQIAGGSRQRFEKFDRLTMIAPAGDPKMRVINLSPHPIDIYRENKTGHRFAATIDDKEFMDTKMVEGEQLYLLPRPAPFQIPDQPLLFQAQLHVTPQHLPQISQMPQYHGQKPPYFIELNWTHPLHNTGALEGYNVYQAVFDGEMPVSHLKLNGPPQHALNAKIWAYPLYGPRNVRYAVTAVNLDGIESLFSNVRIYDPRTRTDLFDAGFIPL